MQPDDTHILSCIPVPVDDSSDNRGETTAAAPLPLGGPTSSKPSLVEKGADGLAVPAALKQQSSAQEAVKHKRQGLTGDSLAGGNVGHDEGVGRHLPRVQEVGDDFHARLEVRLEAVQQQAEASTHAAAAAVTKAAEEAIQKIPRLSVEHLQRAGEAAQGVELPGAARGFGSLGLQSTQQGEDQQEDKQPASHKVHRLKTDLIQPPEMQDSSKQEADSQAKSSREQQSAGEHEFVDDEGEAYHRPRHDLQHEEL